MTTELLEIMQKDIKRCEEAQDSNEGTHRLQQALIAKYNGIFEGFEKDIPTSGKAAFGGGEFNYRPELNAINGSLIKALMQELHCYRCYCRLSRYAQEHSVRSAVNSG